MDPRPGTVTHLPLKLCSGCVNGLVGSFGIYCEVIGQDIWDERIARTCGAWEPIPLAPVVLLPTAKRVKP